MLCQFHDQQEANARHQIEQYKVERKMKTRFIKSVIATAETADVQMPWTRGKRRQAFIHKRKEQAKHTRKFA
jgi:hypothetical protein